MSGVAVALLGALGGIAVALLLVASARGRRREGRPLPGTGPDGRGDRRVEHTLEAAVWLFGTLVVLVIAALLGLFGL